MFKFCGFIFLTIFLSLTWCKRTNAQDSRDNCKNLLLNGEASTQDAFWTKKGHWARTIEPSNNHNYAFSLWNSPGEESGFLQTISLDPKRSSDIYTLSGWVKREVSSERQLGSPTIKVKFFDKDQQLISETSIGFGSSDSWSLLKKNVRIPARSIEAVIHLYALDIEAEKKSMSKGEWKALFDNISFSACDHNLPKPGKS